MLGEIPGEEKKPKRRREERKRTQDTTFLATHGLNAVRRESRTRRSRGGCRQARAPADVQSRRPGSVGGKLAAASTGRR